MENTVLRSPYCNLHNFAVRVGTLSNACLCSSCLGGSVRLPSSDTGTPQDACSVTLPRTHTVFVLTKCPIVWLVYPRFSKASVWLPKAGNLPHYTKLGPTLSRSRATSEIGGAFSLYAVCASAPGNLVVCTANTLNCIGARSVRSASADSTRFGRRWTVPIESRRTEQVYMRGRRNSSRPATATHLYSSHHILEATLSSFVYHKLQPLNTPEH